MVNLTDEERERDDHGRDVARMEYERNNQRDRADALEAHVKELNRDWVAHWDDCNSLCAYGDGRCSCGLANVQESKPDTSLARLKAQWLADSMRDVPYKDLHTSKGDLRRDVEFRAGWNACREAFRLGHLRRQAKEGK